MDKIKEFIQELDNEKRKQDALELLTIVEDASGYKPYLYGKIIGYGKYHYKYESGTEGNSAVVAFSPRKQNLVIYIMPGFSEYQNLLEKLGKYKLGKSCLYLTNLKNIDIKILKQLIAKSVKDMQKKYDCIET